MSNGAAILDRPTLTLPEPRLHTESTEPAWFLAPLVYGVERTNPGSGLRRKRAVVVGGSCGHDHHSHLTAMFAVTDADGPVPIDAVGIADSLDGPIRHEVDIALCRLQPNDTLDVTVPVPVGEG